MDLPAATHWQRTMLVLLLRVSGLILLSALGAALLPFAWMSAANDALGLAPLEPTPLTGYLTRSLSLLYAFHGSVVLLISLDVDQYRPLIRALGLLQAAFGVGMLGVDLATAMPLFWTLGEAPGTILAGLVIFALAGTAPTLAQQQEKHQREQQGLPDRV